MSYDNIHQNSNKDKLSLTEEYMPAIPLKDKLFTDSGYRMRKNIFSL